MKKYVALSLAMMLGWGFTCASASAASKEEMAAELQVLSSRLQELEVLSQKQKAQKKAAAAGENQLNFDGSELRMRWIKNNVTGGDGVFSNRSRLRMNYKIDDKTIFTTRWGVIEENELGDTGSDDRYKVIDANVTFKDVMDTDVTVGRFGQKFGATGYWNSTSLGNIDGIKVAYGEKVKMITGFATFKAVNSSIEDAFFMNASYDLNNDITLYGMWIRERTGVDSDYDVRGLGVQYDVSSDLKFSGDFTRNYRSGVGTLGKKPLGYYMGLKWKDAKNTVPGSYGVTLLYRNIENGNIFSTAATSSSIPLQSGGIGYKGPALAVEYTMAKNVIFAAYQTFNSFNADTGKALKGYTRIQTTVGF